jgi:hypothetical protein
MFKNVDTSGLTPEQLADAELMQEYAASPACRSNFQTVQHAERLLGHLIESEHRLAPVDAFTLALKYAEHAHNAGEDYMQAAFETWKANRPAKAVEQVVDLGAETASGEVEMLEFPIDHTETITRDDAIADTERHVNEGGRDIEQATV